MKYVVEKLNSSLCTLHWAFCKSWDAVIERVCAYMQLPSYHRERITIAFSDHEPGPDEEPLWHYDEDFCHCTDAEGYLIDNAELYSHLCHNEVLVFECENDGTWSFSCLEFG